MLRLSVFLVFLVISVVLGLMVLNHPGYVFVVYQPWMVQMPLWVVLLGVIIVLGLFYVLIDSVDQVHMLWFRLKNWFRWRREHRAYSQTQHGLTLLIEGRWMKAERLLLKGVKNTIDPLMNYLGAAKAAQARGALDKRDQYLREAHRVASDAELAIGLTKIELQLEAHQLEQAAATINRLLTLSPRHPGVLKLAEKIYIQLSDWQALQALLPKFRKARVFNKDELIAYESEMARILLNAYAGISLTAVNAVYDDLPRAVRYEPSVVIAYTKALVAQGEPTKAIALIRRALKSYYDPHLLALYLKLPHEDTHRELVMAGGWLKLHGAQPELLLWLGKLCVEAKLWGKAKDYFNQCLALGPNAQASLAYGRLLEQLDEPTAAMAVYRNALIP